MLFCSRLPEKTRRMLGKKVIYLLSSSGSPPPTWQQILHSCLPWAEGEQVSDLGLYFSGVRMFDVKRSLTSNASNSEWVLSVGSLLRMRLARRLSSLLKWFLLKKSAWNTSIPSADETGEFLASMSVGWAVILVRLFGKIGKIGWESSLFFTTRVTQLPCLRLGMPGSDPVMTSPNTFWHFSTLHHFANFQQEEKVNRSGFPEEKPATWNF